MFVLLVNAKSHLMPTVNLKLALLLKRRSQHPRRLERRRPHQQNQHFEKGSFAISTSKSRPAKRRPSAEIEDVADEDDLTYSERPHNPRNILEAADGSDDDNNGVPPPGAMDIDADVDKEKDMVEIVEAPEEDEEVELGPYQS